MNGKHTFVAGRRRLKTTPAFDSYWAFASERQRIFFRRVRQEPPPWTDDPVLATNRFTNAYRASDRVSQYLINKVIYGAGSAHLRSTILRILMFKLFNRIDTWEYLECRVGAVCEENFDVNRYTAILDTRAAGGHPLYSGAYIMPSPKLGAASKHANHLRLLGALLSDGTVDRIGDAHTLRQLVETLSNVHSFGPFLAFQFAIDLNYSDLFGFSEMDHVVAGPGAVDGIAKCFSDTDGLDAGDVVKAVTEAAPKCFVERDIAFDSLWGRPLQLIDCQNLFCEISKYARVAYPDLQGRSGRTQIKRRYAPSGLDVRVGYPPRWALEYDRAIPVAATQAELLA